MVKNFLKLNQTRYRVSHVYLDYRTKEIFAVDFVGKKISFSYGNLRLFRINFEYKILKIGLFRRVKVFSKSNQTWYGVSSVYLECNAEGIFAIACLGK